MKTEPRPQGAVTFAPESAQHVWLRLACVVGPVVNPPKEILALVRLYDLGCMNLKGSMLRFFASMLLLLPATLAAASGDKMTRQDYAIYSAVLASIRLSHADHREALAIVRDTIDPHEFPNPTQDCSSLPFEFRRHASPSIHRKTLKNKKLVIGRRYILLTPQEADTWRQQRFAPKMPTDPPAAKLADPFAGTSDLIQLSNIFFNAKKTVALVYVSATCGSLCMSSQWYLVEKTKGVWRVLPIPGCGTIS